MKFKNIKMKKQYVTPHIVEEGLHICYDNISFSELVSGNSIDIIVKIVSGVQKYNKEFANLFVLISENPKTTR
jgi:hypothetical protein